MLENILSKECSSTIKYGRRPVYVISFTLYTACTAWAGRATSYGKRNHGTYHYGLCRRCGRSHGAIDDLRYLLPTRAGHHHGIYTFSLCAGLGGGIVISGLITIAHGW